MQQYLPFTVLKLSINVKAGGDQFKKVATVLTVYGIETTQVSLQLFGMCRLVATVLTVYGIETPEMRA